MFTLLRVLMVWRIARLLLPLAICGLLVALLAIPRSLDGHSRSQGRLHRPVADLVSFSVPSCPKSSPRAMR